jgi:fibronectin type 3 domain-containing protein
MRTRKSFILGTLIVFFILVAIAHGAEVDLSEGSNTINWEIERPYPTGYELISDTYLCPKGDYLRFEFNLSVDDVYQGDYLRAYDSQDTQFFSRRTSTNGPKWSKWYAKDSVYFKFTSDSISYYDGWGAKVLTIECKKAIYKDTGDQDLDYGVHDVTFETCHPYLPSMDEYSVEYQCPADSMMRARWNVSTYNYRAYTKVFTGEMQDLYSIVYDTGGSPVWTKWYNTDDMVFRFYSDSTTTTDWGADVAQVECQAKIQKDTEDKLDLCGTTDVTFETSHPYVPSISEYSVIYKCPGDSQMRAEYNYSKDPSEYYDSFRIYNGEKTQVVHYPQLTYGSPTWTPWLNTDDLVFYFYSYSDGITGWGLKVLRVQCQSECQNNVQWASESKSMSAQVGGSGAATDTVNAAGDHTGVTVSRTSGQTWITADPSGSIGDMADGASRTITFTCAPPGGTTPAQYEAIFKVTSNEDTTGDTITINCHVSSDDVTPPVASNGIPTKTAKLKPEIQVDTNEPARCRGSFDTDEGYENMDFTFTGADTSHSYTPSDNLTVNTTYVVYVRCSDGAGNTMTSSYSWEMGVIEPDLTAPQRITDLSATAGKCPKVTLTWTKSPDSDLDYYIIYRYSQALTDANKENAKIMDDKIPAANTSYVDLTGKPNTRYFYGIIGGDLSGNEADMSNSPNATVANDTEAPGRITDLKAQVAEAGVILTWSKPDDNVGVDHYVVYRHSDVVTDANKGEAMVLVSNPDDEEYLDSTGVTGTTYYYGVTAFDEIGNEGKMSNSPAATFGQITDVTPPQATFTPANGSIVGGPEIQITLSFNELTNVSLAKLDGENINFSPYMALSQTFAYQTELPDGQYELRIWAQDAPGNHMSARIIFNVDSSLGPSFSIALTPTSGSYVNHEMVQLRASFTRGATIQRSTLDGESVTLDTTDSKAFTAALDLSEGTHTFSVSGEDSLGNKASDSSTFTVDSVVPKVSLPESFKVNETVTLEFSEEMRSVTLYIDGKEVTLTKINGSKFTFSTAGLGGGEHKFRIVANDMAGNRVDEELTVSIAGVCVINDKCEPGETPENCPQDCADMSLGFFKVVEEYFWVLVAVAVVVAGLFVYRKMRSKKRPKKKKPPPREEVERELGKIAVRPAGLPVELKVFDETLEKIKEDLEFLEESGKMDTYDLRVKYVKAASKRVKLENALESGDEATATQVLSEVKTVLDLMRARRLEKKPETKEIKLVSMFDDLAKAVESDIKELEKRKAEVSDLAKKFEKVKAKRDIMVKAFKSKDIKTAAMIVDEIAALSREVESKRESPVEIETATIPEIEVPEKEPEKHKLIGVEEEIPEEELAEVEGEPMLELEGELEEPAAESAVEIKDQAKEMKGRAILQAYDETLRLIEFKVSKLGERGTPGVDKLEKRLPEMREKRGELLTAFENGAIKQCDALLNELNEFGKEVDSKAKRLVEEPTEKPIIEELEKPPATEKKEVKAFKKELLGTFDETLELIGMQIERLAKTKKDTPKVKQMLPKLKAKRKELQMAFRKYRTLDGTNINEIIDDYGSLVKETDRRMKEAEGK